MNTGFLWSLNEEAASEAIREKPKQRQIRKPDFVQETFPEQAKEKLEAIADIDAGRKVSLQVAQIPLTSATPEETPGLRTREKRERS